MHAVTNSKRKILISDTQNKFCVVYIRNHPKDLSLSDTILSVINFKDTNNVLVDFYNGGVQHRTGIETISVSIKMMQGVYDDMMEYIETYRPSNISFNLKFSKKDKKSANKKAKEQIFTMMANRIKKKTGYNYEKIISSESNSEYRVTFNITY